MILYNKIQHCNYLILIVLLLTYYFLTPLGLANPVTISTLLGITDCQLVQAPNILPLPLPDLPASLNVATIISDELTPLLSKLFTARTSACEYWGQSTISFLGLPTFPALPFRLLKYSTLSMKSSLPNTKPFCVTLLNSLTMSSSNVCSNNFL